MKLYLFALLVLVWVLTLPCESAAASGWVIAWGGNATGFRADRPSLTTNGLVALDDRFSNNVVSVSAGDSHALALSSDGRVVGWGFDSNSQVSKVAGLSKITAVAAGNGFSLVLDGDGRVFGAGINIDGEATGVPTLLPPFTSFGLVTVAGKVLSDVAAIAAGNGHSLALKKDGTVVSWGRAGKAAASLSNVVAISATRSVYGHDLALRRDGTVCEWQIPTADHATLRPGLTNIVAIAAGYTHALAIAAGGTVVAWGANGHEEADVPAGLSNVVAVGAGVSHSTALKADGTLVEWGSRGRRPEGPIGLSNVLAIAVGADFNLAITTSQK